MAYDDTPPSSPCESSVKRSYDQMSSSSESTDEYRVDITKEYILDVMRVLLVLKDPEDNEKYERIFLTNEGIWNLLKDEINEFGDACTSKQLAKWIANDGNWGQLERQQADGARSRGRYMYLLRSQYRSMHYNLISLSQSRKNLIAQSNMVLKFDKNSPFRLYFFRFM
ncbi:MAG: hypothetical protein EXX96DRAFT_263713 [Benjaminiella poitrasii]|nr:MAG: hypothetical protein EXX96DRAFT_263713 [Benjaminiella poitrasii]